MQALNVTPGVPTAARGTVAPFSPVVPYFPERNYTISGVCRDATGAVLSGCFLLLYNSVTLDLEQFTISDLSGNYSFIVDKNKFWFIAALKTVPPQITGLTISSLRGV